MVTIKSLTKTAPKIRTLQSIIVNNERSHLYDPKDPDWLRLTGLALKATEIEILLIDDINRVSNFLLNQLDRLCKLVRKNNRAFGGLCVCGFADFLDLPPADYHKEDPETKKKIYYHLSPAFESHVWVSTPPVNLYIRGDNYRFTGADLELIRLLRYGKHEDLEVNPRLNTFCSNDILTIDDLTAKQCYLVPCRALDH